MDVYIMRNTRGVVNCLVSDVTHLELLKRLICPFHLSLLSTDNDSSFTRPMFCDAILLLILLYEADYVSILLLLCGNLYTAQVCQAWAGNMSNFVLVARLCFRGPKSPPPEREALATRPGPPLCAPRSR